MSELSPQKTLINLVIGNIESLKMSEPTQPIERVLENINQIQPGDFSSDGDRNQALLAAYALIGRLETPWETVLRLCMNQVSLFSLF